MRFLYRARARTVLVHFDTDSALQVWNQDGLPHCKFDTSPWAYILPFGRTDRRTGEKDVEAEKPRWATTHTLRSTGPVGLKPLSRRGLLLQSSPHSRLTTRSVAPPVAVAARGAIESGKWLNSNSSRSSSSARKSTSSARAVWHWILHLRCVTIVQWLHETEGGTCCRWSMDGYFQE